MWIRLWKEGYLPCRTNHSPPSPFRSIMLCIQQYFSPSSRRDYQGIFFNMIQLPLFIRQSETRVILDVIPASWHTCLNWDTGIQAPVWHVRWVSNSSMMRTGLSLNCMDHLCPHYINEYSKGSVSKAAIIICRLQYCEKFCCISDHLDPWRWGKGLNYCMQ